MDPQQLLTYANEFARAFPWDTLVNAGAISPLLLGYKHWLQLEGDKQYKVGPLKFRGEQIMLGLITLFSTAAPIVWAAIQGQSDSLHLMILKGAVTGFMTQPVYYLLLKPAIRYFNKQVEAEVGRRMAAVIVPPVTATPDPSATPKQFN